MTTVSSASSEIVVSGTSQPADQLTLLVNGQVISGWEDVAVTLRLEGFPNSFDVRASIGPAGQAPIAAGDDCVVKLGNDTVITGWVDRVAETGTAESHQIAISGRGLTEDLVDCAAEWPSAQLVGGNALTIAQRLADAYGIDVIMADGADPGPTVVSWALNYGETGADIIQRVARNAGLLAFENAQGQLVLGIVGSTTAASGIVYGQNVEVWSVEQSMDQRFSDYIGCFQSLDTFGALGGSDFFAGASDPNVPRHRVTHLIMEVVAADPQDFTQQRAQWEAARRAGRSFVVKVTVDSWRDSAGNLWMPNTLVSIDVPGAASAQTGALVIAEVTFRRNEDRGTVAEILAMTPAAFLPEPIVLQPVNTAALTG
ncbi:phage baseplate assembly protein [Novosphingobium sp. FSW06-99]|uniref:phage baseplate assembly protein n=1 Tax=Novosphingobium sp. FSW06-99 TaxID=1739113 RepID=UPI00076D2F99|nr:contractile injection system protein, VgrG/Pvc8 family [Novosphingobium sp. FSW06-99]KUR80754.1 hypothetical protein AQZ49_01625 [Novosphingobium sp. FSW06-99]